MLDRVSGKNNSVEHLLLQSLKTQIIKRTLDIEVDAEHAKEFCKLHKILINFKDTRTTQQDYLQLNTIVFRILDLKSDVAKYFINSFIKQFTNQSFAHQNSYPLISINIKKQLKTSAGVVTNFNVSLRIGFTKFDFELM